MDTAPSYSILSETIRILHECEQAEISSKSHLRFFLVRFRNDFLCRCSNAIAPLLTAFWKQVTELSCLLVLGEYEHARHLWHRYRDICPSQFYQLLDQESLQSFSTVDSELSDLFQFFVLWNRIAKPMLRYQPHLVMANAKSLLSLRLGSSGSITEESLPIFTLLEQVTFHYQESIFIQMEERYDSISEEKLFSNAFGYNSLQDSDLDVREEMRNVVRRRGWTNHLSSQSWIPTSTRLNKKMDQGHKSDYNEETIQSMIQTVAFLEQKLSL
jgi:hypothetical protein